MIDLFRVSFPVAGIETSLFLPPAAAFAISYFTSMAGISGAFLLLPFQVSVLGFASPSASATNFVYNVVGTPGGFIRYAAEKRLVWPLAAGMVAGAVPGVFAGYFLRVRLFPDPASFKMFVALMLFYVGYRLIRDVFRQTGPPADSGSFRISGLAADFKTLRFRFLGEDFCIRIPWILFPSMGVGVVSGMYGIGGGALLAPFLTTVLRIPLHVAAGAVLLSNFATSLSGVLFYSFFAFGNGNSAPPDLLLGVLFGLGGLLGMYCGARTQHRVPEKAIKWILTAIVFSTALKYTHSYLFRPV